MRGRLAGTSLEGMAIVACSALKAAYRDVLRSGPGDVRIVYLKGSYDLIDGRLRDRPGHFFDPALLASQFDALEEPADALVVEVAPGPGEVVAEIRGRLGLGG